jgi:macrolide-specific efflux system membrane fusion protein
MKNHKKASVVAALIILLVIYFGRNSIGQKPANQYQTAQAEKGTLITTVSASGSILGGNNISVTTNATGVVSQVYVKDGEKVMAGQKIADITLDQNAKQRQTSAWASYLSAKNSLASTKVNQYTLQNQLFVANQKFINDAVARGLVVGDPTYIEENATWLAAEAQYKNQSGVISQAEANLSNAWVSYQQSSSLITAPVAGTINDLAIASGVPISGSSTSSSVSTQTIATISTPGGNVLAVVNIAEIDSPKVKTGQKATLTLDAFPSVTFTGKVVVMNTSGQTSSGVTTYPATIALDSTNNKIYPGMGADAKIITNIKNDVILVPSGAVQTTNGQSTVKVLKNGQITTVSVEIGDSNDTQTEITSGLNASDTVVTSTTTTGTTSQTRTSTSPFGAFGGGGGGNFRIRGD